MSNTNMNSSVSSGDTTDNSPVNTVQTSSPHHQHHSPSMEGTKKAICSNWKTTVIGIVLSFTGFVAFSPNTFGGEQSVLVQLCRYITSGGLAVLGVSAKDFNVSGGDKE